MTSDERLERLERSVQLLNRRGRFLFACLLLTLTAWGTHSMHSGTVVAAQAVTEEVRGKAILLEDNAGRVRASIRMMSNGPALALLSEDGRPQVLLAMAADGPSLTMTTESGSRAVALHVLKEGSALFLDDERGTPRAVLAITSDGPSLHLFDTNRVARAIVGSGQVRVAGGQPAKFPESSVVLLGPAGDPVWSAPR